MKVQEGAHLAVGLVRNARPGIIIAPVIPPGRRHRGDPALHGHACSPDLLRTLPQGIENAHPGDGNPFVIVFMGGDWLESMANPGGWGFYVWRHAGWRLRNLLGRRLEGLMQQERAFGQLAVKGLQLLDFADQAGAGPAHELPAFQTGLLIKRHPAWPVHASGRSEEAPRGHLFHSRPEGSLVLVARGELPLQRQDGGHSRGPQGSHPKSGALARNDSSPRRRFHDHPPIERRQGARFDDLLGGQIGRAHLDGVRAQQGGHECGFPIEDAPGKDHATVLEQGWLAPFEVQHHLRQGQRAMLPHVAAGLVPLADHVTDARFQGEPEQVSIGGDVRDLDAAFQQFSYGGEVPSGDPDKTGPMSLYPSQMRLPERVLCQRHDVHRIRAPVHDLRQASQPPVTGLRVHHAQGDGGQSAGIGHP